jgi:hypothetical protein
LAVLVEPTRGLVPATDGSLLYPTDELAAVAGSPSFLRMLRPLVLEGLAEPAFSPRSPLFTLGLAPWVPVGASGLRIARGPVEVADPGPVRRSIRASRSRPVVRSLRSITRPLSSGWTEIFVPAGRTLGLWFARFILFRLLSESPRRALAAM